MKIYAVVSNYEDDRFLIATFLDKKRAEYEVWEYQMEIGVPRQKIDYYEENNEIVWTDKYSSKVNYIRIEESEINPYSCDGKNLFCKEVENL